MKIRGYQGMKLIQELQVSGRQVRLRRLWRGLLLFIMGCLTVLLTSQLTLTPAIAVPDAIAKAPVLLDGQVLFEVGASGNFTAQERAEIINQALAETVRSPDPIDVDVEQNGPTYTIRTGEDRVLVTLTQSDVIPGSRSSAQAYQWRQKIEQALRQSQFERTSGYRRQVALLAAIVFLGAIVLNLGIRFLGQIASLQLRRWLGRSTSLLHEWDQTGKLMLQLGLLGIQAGLWIAVLRYVTDLFPETRDLRYRLWNFLDSPILPFGEKSYSASDLLLLLASSIVLWFVVNAITRLLRTYVLRHAGADPALEDVVTVLTQYTLTFLGMIVLLQVWEFDVSSLTILASILGVGIGFGVQNIANNFISGIIITLERPVQIGDFVSVGELLGTVERIGVRSTEIRTLDRVSIIVPNSRFLENEVVNWNHGDSISRLRISVGVAYGSDVEKVQAALLDAARSHPEVLITPRPKVWFQEFGDNALKFDLLVWTGDPKQQARIKSDLNYRIEACLRRYNIDVPFPQRDLHVRSPKLDALIDLWLQKSVPNSTNGSGDRIPALVDPAALQTEASPETMDRSLTEPAPLPDWTIPGTAVTHTELQELAEAMRGPNGVEICDRRYRLNIYPNCFVGAEAVDWLMEHRNYSKAEAIAVGQLMMEQNMIHHVVDDQPFRDGYFFYRFYADEV